MDVLLHTLPLRAFDVTPMRWYAYARCCARLNMLRHGMMRHAADLLY